MVYTLLFFIFSKRSLFHNYNVFGSCTIHILYTGCAKIKKNNSGAKRLMLFLQKVLSCWWNRPTYTTSNTQIDKPDLAADYLTLRCWTWLLSLP